jgi:hypothetical protein
MGVGTRGATAAVGVLALLGASCSRQGANDEDHRRVAVLVADPLLVSLAPVATLVQEPAGDVAGSDLPWAEGGGTNTAGSAFVTDATEASLARLAVAALAEQGWTQVEAACTFLPDRSRWVIGIGAGRWFDGFEGRASVNIEPGADGTTRVLVTISAPFHTQKGSRPIEAEAAVACIDDADAS